MPGKTNAAAKPVSKPDRKNVGKPAGRLTTPATLRAAGPPVRIRTAVPDDLGTLTRLRRQAEQVHARLLSDYFRVSTESDLTPRVAAPGTVTLVAEVSEVGASAPAGDSVLGYVTVKVVDTPRDPAMTPRRRVHVETVVVDERHRGAGIGTALMRAAAAWARRQDATELVLTVWSDNAAAEALYRRLNYHPIARVLRHQLDPE